MKKRMIDADALLTALSKITFPREDGIIPNYNKIMDKVKLIVNELATPAHKAQKNKIVKE